MSERARMGEREGEREISSRPGFDSSGCYDPTLRSITRAEAAPMWCGHSVRLFKE
jgi:hypothetical protein